MKVKFYYVVAPKTLCSSRNFFLQQALRVVASSFFSFSSNLLLPFVDPKITHLLFLLSSQNLHFKKEIGFPFLLLKPQKTQTNSTPFPLLLFSSFQNSKTHNKLGWKHITWGLNCCHIVLLFKGTMFEFQPCHYYERFSQCFFILC